ncbi:uncharacterized protein [Physcomitrium patens]|uniref:uncharacterized protein isoform X2 n=1 Tax=Physcomitrium patens TaxID=3218 RepID=UPI003CCDADA6
MKRVGERAHPRDLPSRPSSHVHLESTLVRSPQPNIVRKDLEYEMMGNLSLHFPLYPLFLYTWGTGPRLLDTLGSNLSSSKSMRDF